MTDVPSTAILPGQVAVITPTKGRHRQLTHLLQTLASQADRPGQVLIADGGRDAALVVDRFKDLLPVEWVDCPMPGQIVQRNHALTRLRDEIRLVIYFDDDIQLQHDALQILLKFWNSRPVQPAGVSFNITNMPAQPDSTLRRLFLSPSEPKGRVFRSGYNSPVSNLASDLTPQWLIGGATAWRRDLLEQERAEPITSRWAICEDLIFSYPVGKREPLYVCAAAQVLHVDDEPTETYKAGLFRGRNATIWRYYFVTRHPELSKLAFFWMVFGQSLGRLVSALTGKGWQFGYIFGNAVGLAVCARALLTGRDIRHDLK